MNPIELALPKIEPTPYVDLLKKIASLANCDDVEQVCINETVNIDGLLLNFFSQEDHPNEFFIFCDIVKLPENHGKQILKKVLEYNLELYNGFSPVLCFKSSTRTIQCVARFFTDETDANILFQKINDFKSDIENWRNKILNINKDLLTSNDNYKMVNMDCLVSAKIRGKI